MIAECSKEHGVSEGDIQAAKAAQSAKDLNSCFIGCFFKKVGVVSIYRKFTYTHPWSTQIYPLTSFNNIHNFLTYNIFSFCTHMVGGQKLFLDAFLCTLTFFTFYLCWLHCALTTVVVLIIWDFFVVWTFTTPKFLLTWYRTQWVYMEKGSQEYS